VKAESVLYGKSAAGVRKNTQSGSCGKRLCFAKGVTQIGDWRVRSDERGGGTLRNSAASGKGLRKVWRR